MEYQINVKIDYGKLVVTLECPELELVHTSRLSKTIAKTLAIPTTMIASEVTDYLKEMERQENDG